jgi:signal transduction histidine kinase
MKQHRVLTPVWLILAAVAIGDMVLHIPLLRADPYHNMKLQAAARAVGSDAWMQSMFPTYLAAQNVLALCVFVAAAIVIYWRRRGDGMAWLASLALLTWPILAFWGGLEQSYHWRNAYGQIWGPWLYWGNTVLRALGALFFFLLLYLFPDGRLPVRWGLPGLALAVVLSLVLASEPVLSWQGRLPHVSGNYIIDFLLPLAITLIIGATVQIARYRSTHNEVHRQQIKWIALAFTALVSVWMLAALIGSLLMAGFLVTDSAMWDWFDLIFLHAEWLALLMLPVALATSVLRYQLWNAEPLLARSLLYGALAAFVVVTYVLLVGGLGALVNWQGQALPPLVPLLASGLIAALFNPVRVWLQRMVNRLFYGMREEPYQVVEALSRRLARGGEPMLRDAVESIGRALKLPFVEIDAGALREVFGQRPVNAADPVSFALAYQGERLGELRIAPRDGESLDARDRDLLTALARQAGVALHAARATADLRQSRERLVTAREEERRRLRRELHDGLGPTLASLYQRIDAARQGLAVDPAASARMLDDVAAEMKHAIGGVRSLAYALRPPALDEFGLIGALNELARQHMTGVPRLTIEVHADTLPPLSAAVEVAAYRIVSEALTNVIRHARATRCDVRLTAQADMLSVRVEDDGAGLPADLRSGVGLLSMRERAEELGGSVRLMPRQPHGATVDATVKL